MHLSIGHKIFSGVLFTLLSMAAVVGYSLYQTRNIADEIRIIATHRIPLSQTVNRLNELYLQHNAIIQQTISQPLENISSENLIRIHLQKINEASEQAKAAFAEAYEYLEDDGETLDAQHIHSIQISYHNLEHQTAAILNAKLNKDFLDYTELLSKLSHHQNTLENDIVRFRRHLTASTNASVQQVNHAEQNILQVNTLLGILALATSTIIALYVTKRITYRIQRLKDGANTVVKGDLDTYLPVLEQDELGELTVSFNEMVKGLRQRERIKETFGKYMDQRVVSNLLDHPELTKPGGIRRNMTVMFVDLKDFTTLSEKLAPDDLIHLVNTFFSHVSEVISAHKGVVDKYMGDAVMAYWGAPFCQPEQHAFLASTAALRIGSNLENLRHELTNGLQGRVKANDIDFRIGISTGDVILGTVGSQASRSFTVMGPPVNTGARLESANKAYGTRILMCQNTRIQTQDSIHTREIDRIKVKGGEHPVEIYEPALTAPSFPDLSDALSAYRSQNWDLAEGLFRKHPEDTVAKAFLHRISTLRTTALPDDWDGTWIFETK